MYVASSVTLTLLHVPSWRITLFLVVVEAAQKFKRIQDLERVSPCYGVSVRSREFLYGNYVASLRAGEVATRYPSVNECTSRYSEGLARR